MGTIFFTRFLLFFNGHDVDLYVGYVSLKTLHYLVKLIGARAGEVRGAAALPPPPPQILGNSVFLGNKKEIGQSQFLKTSPWLFNYFEDQAPVVQKMDSAIHRINHYPVDKYQGNQLCYPLDSDLSDG